MLIDRILQSKKRSQFNMCLVSFRMMFVLAVLVCGMSICKAFPSAAPFIDTDTPTADGKNMETSVRLEQLEQSLRDINKKVHTLENQIEKMISDKPSEHPSNTEHVVTVGYAASSDGAQGGTGGKGQNKFDTVFRNQTDDAKMLDSENTRSSVKPSNGSTLIHPKALKNDAGFTSRRKKRSTNRYRSEPDHSVAFTAYLQSAAVNLRHGEALVLGGVLFNDVALSHNTIYGYNRISGVFTCPTGGVYMFTFSVSNINTVELNVMLVVNGDNVMGATAEPSRPDQDAQGSNVAILRLDHSDKVWLRIANYGPVTVQGSNQFRDTSFSGVLLYR